MAYNAGASISGKDFMDFHFTGDKTPWDVFAMESEVFVNRIYPTKGPAIGGRGAWIDPIFKVEKYGPPIKRFFEEEEISIDIQDPRNKGKSVIPIMPDGNIVMGSATGLGVHKSEGIWPVDEKCFSGIEGLYSAGDALASYISGTCYPSTGLALSGSAVQGYRAGEYASEYTNNIDYGTISENVIKRFTAKILNPLFIDKGFNPRWVNNVLLNTMSPFYILLIMNEERLKSALKQIEYLKNSTENRMRAGNLHELRLVFETKNILLNAEMKLRANIFRTESRGNHFREDFPYRNDKEWLAWVLIGKDENGIMKLRKEPVPEKWKTDIDEPYDKRYPNRFPGEAVNSVQ
jgi:succinate dehydrogenase/fumarate reductase flavoprotein subunit